MPMPNVRAHVQPDQGREHEATSHDLRMVTQRDDPRPPNVRLVLLGDPKHFLLPISLAGARIGGESG